MVDKQRAMAAVRELLCAIGEDPDREGLAETPKRVADMYAELVCGVDIDPSDILHYFNEDCHEEMVVVKDIAFHSMCEHHMLPFHGTVDICYIPTTGKLLGLSKLARIVELYARRLQLQERMCFQIADLLMTEAEAAGVAVIIRAEHMCMSMRGVKKPGTLTLTTAFRGKIKDNMNLRNEAMALMGTLT